MNDIINGAVLCVVAFLIIVGIASLKTKYDKANRAPTPVTTKAAR